MSTKNISIFCCLHEHDTIDPLYLSSLVCRLSLSLISCIVFQFRLYPHDIHQHAYVTLFVLTRDRRRRDNNLVI